MRFHLAASFLVVIFSTSAQFKKQKSVAQIGHDLLLEASGLDQSYENPNHFWSHNDSGGKAAVYLLDQSGAVKMEVTLMGVKNRDWEELVTVREGEETYVYIAEIGDNRAVHNELRIYRISEPKFRGARKVKVPNDEIDVMTFKYAEGARDAEAIFYDIVSKEFVLITKREEKSWVYSFPFSSDDQVRIITSLGEVPDRNFTAADMNEKGEILLKTYGRIYFFEGSDKPAAARILSWRPTKLSYQPEPQGEAMCWLGDSFYTLSEKNQGFVQELLFFERIK